METGRDLGVGGGELWTTSPITGLLPGPGDDGPEEVLIQGGNVSVKGQLVPDGEFQLLSGEGQSAHPQGGAQKCQLRTELAAASPTLTVVGRHLEMREPAEEPGVKDLVPVPTPATNPHQLPHRVTWGKSFYLTT